MQWPRVAIFREEETKKETDGEKKERIQIREETTPRLNLLSKLKALHFSVPEKNHKTVINNPFCWSCVGDGAKE